MLGEDRKTPTKCFRTLWTFAEDHFNPHDLKSILLTTNTSGFTIFHEIILEGDEKTFSFMLEIHERVLDKEELKSLIMKKFQGKKTLLFKSIGATIESILMVWDFLQDLLDDDEEELKKFISHRDDFGDTAFSCVDWLDAFPKELFAPFITENFSKVEAEKLYKKVIGEISEEPDMLSDNEPSVATANETESQKVKRFALNCFCCGEEM